MSETIEYNGNVYEIELNYLFGDEKHGVYHCGKLLGINSDGEFCTEHDVWELCEELPASNELGSITKAPIKLEDGECYQFEYIDRGTCRGIYSKLHHAIIGSELDYVAKNCTNIRKMVVES